MTDDTLTKVLLLLVGTTLGILGSAITTAVKNALDRKAELEKKAEAAWLDSLSPLQIATKELYKQLEAVRDELPRVHENYSLRWEFDHCRAYIVSEKKEGTNEKWTDEEKREEISFESGGVGNQAISTLYITTYYLYYATRVLLRIPYIESKKKAEELSHSIEKIRSRFERIGFYPVTQDSIGISMKGSVGEIMSYREFCEAITNKSQRGWFMTLADVYSHFYERKPEQVNAIIDALKELEKALEPFKRTMS